MADGGVIIIETSSAPLPPNQSWIDPAAPFGDFRLTISDTGRGMSQATLQQAINPFARTKPDGTGLAWPACRSS